MYRKFFYSLLILATVLSLTAAAQQKTDDKRKKAAEAEEKVAQPSDEHKKLAQLAGTWTVEGKIYAGSRARPLALKGTTENTMVLGGRFLKCEAHGTMPMPVESLAIIGFDGRYDRYTYVGYDNGGTFYITAQGKFDAASNTLAMYGEEADPTLAFTEKYDISIRMDGPDKYTLEFVFKNPEMTGGQKEFKVFEAVYTRVH